MTRFAELLTSEQVECVHEASLEILENVGLLVHNEKARTRFGQHDCHVDSETQGMFSGPNHVEKVSASFGTAICSEMADSNPQRPDLGSFGHCWRRVGLINRQRFFGDKQCLNGVLNIP